MAEGKLPSQFDRQEGGAHYKGRAIQPLEFTISNQLDACQHSIVKYVTRFRDKNQEEDLKKAIHYCQILLETEYGVRSLIDYEKTS